MGLFTGQNQFFYVPCIPLQQLCRFLHSDEEAGFHCLTREHQPFLFFTITSITVKQQKTFLGFHESQFHAYVCRQASEGLRKKLTVIIASS